MKSPDQMTEEEVRYELWWWRHFASKVTHDSEMPRVHSALLGYLFEVKVAQP